MSDFTLSEAITVIAAANTHLGEVSTLFAELLTIATANPAAVNTAEFLHASQLVRDSFMVQVAMIVGAIQEIEKLQKEGNN